MRDEIDRIGAGIEEILGQTGCSSEQEFFRHFDICQRREQLRSKRDELKMKILATTGRKDWEEVHRTLERWDKARLESERLSLSKKMEDMQKEIEDVYEKRAEAAQRLDHLADSTEHTELLARHSVLIQELHDLSERWMISALALHLLDSAKERFEQENQPKVFKTASSLFATITGNRYTDIVAPVGKSEMIAVRADGRRMQLEELSRGTAEQLYLCIRFGVISVCETGSEVLPVLMDDILVNFDPDRAGQAARVISDLSAERQILFFTCHPYIVDILKAAAPGATVFSMDGDVSDKASLAQVEA